MQPELVEINVRGLMPFNNGIAVFLGPADKAFVIHVDPATGRAMHMALQGRQSERPMTHELIDMIFTGFGVQIERVLVNKCEEGTFHALLTLRMQNELGMKIVEIDARPSDCIVLAIQSHSPIFVTKEVLDQVEDMTELLERLRGDGNVAG